MVELYIKVHKIEDKRLNSKLRKLRKVADHASRKWLPVQVYAKIFVSMMSKTSKHCRKHEHYDITFMKGAEITETSVSSFMIYMHIHMYP